MNIEQRANIKFCFKLGKTFTETVRLMNQVYGSECLSRGRIHEWYTRFKNGRVDIKDEQHIGQPKSVITPDSIKIVDEFIKEQPKSSLKFMESKLGISKTSIYRILTEHLNYRKVGVRFVPHELTEKQKLLRIQHSMNIIKEAKKEVDIIKSTIST